MCRETEKGVVISVRVVPRSSRTECAGMQGDALKLKITAPPVEGKANEECIRFLSEILGVRRSDIAILSGHRSKNKQIIVSGATRADIEAALFRG